MVSRLLAVVGVVAAVVTTTGCTADKAEACKNIDQEIQALFQVAPKQAHDKPVLARTLHEAAGKIRDEGGPVGGNVEEASENAAVALERVADRVNEVISTRVGEVAVFEMGEYECGADDVTNGSGAGGGVTEAAPAAGEEGEAAFSVAAHRPQ